jgi:hypothetical protein
VQNSDDVLATVLRAVLPTPLEPGGGSAVDQLLPAGGG